MIGILDIWSVLAIVAVKRLLQDEYFVVSLSTIRNRIFLKKSFSVFGHFVTLLLMIDQKFFNKKLLALID